MCTVGNGIESCDIISNYIYVYIHIYMMIIYLFLLYAEGLYMDHFAGKMAFIYIHAFMILQLL